MRPLREGGPFRLLLVARATSFLAGGTLATLVAWQVFQITQSSAYVGLVGFCLAGGLVLGSIAGGRLADRVDRRLPMLWSRIAYLGVALLLAFNAARAAPDLWLIYVAAALSGALSGVGAPSLMAAMPRLAPKDQLRAAMALASVAIQGGAILGPLLAGVLISSVGMTSSYMAVLVIAAMTPLAVWRLPVLKPAVDAKTADGSRQSASTVAAFLRADRLTLLLLALDGMVLLFTTIVATLPQIAVETFAGSPKTVGILIAAPAFGGILAMVGSGWVNRVQKPAMTILVMALTRGLLIVAFAACANLWAAVLILIAVGAASAVADVLRGALLQTRTPDSLRGRISGLWLMGGTLAPAFGGVLLGVLASRISPGPALAVGGGACLIAAGLILISSSELRAERTLEDKVKRG